MTLIIRAALLAAAVATPPALAETRQAPAPALAPALSASAAAQALFDAGLRRAWREDAPGAAALFRAAREADPGCALCAWGEAWQSGDPRGVARAHALARRAGGHVLALAEALTVREMRGAAAYARAMRAAAARFDDPLVAVVAAGAMLSAEPGLRAGDGAAGDAALRLVSDVMGWLPATRPVRLDEPARPAPQPHHPGARRIAERLLASRPVAATGAEAADERG